MSDHVNIVSLLDALLSSGTRSGSLVDAIDRLTGVLAGSMEVRAMASGQKEHVIAFNDDEKLYLKDSHTPAPFLVAEGRLGNLQNAILKQSWVETVIPVRLRQQAGDTYCGLPLQPRAADYSSTRNFFFRYPEDSFEASGSTTIDTAQLDRDTVQLWIASVGRIVSGAGKFQGARGISVFVGSACLTRWPKYPAAQLDFLRSRDMRIRVSTFVKLVLRDDLDTR